MAAPLGVKFSFDNSDMLEFKRSLLLFPTVYVHSVAMERELPMGILATMYSRLGDGVEPLVDALAEVNAVAPIPRTIAARMYEDETRRRAADMAAASVEDLYKDIESKALKKTGSVPDARNAALSIAGPLMDLAMHDIFTRECATALEEQLKLRCVPLLTGVHTTVAGKAGTRADLLHVVLKRLPLPDKNTPWEAILEWRQDSTVQEQYRRIIATVGNAARQGLAADDFDEELATKLDDYSQAMAIHHKKMALSGLHLFFITVAEVAEHLAHLRFAGAIKTLIDAGHTRLNLLEAELGAPGREFAYIVSANERFRVASG